VPIVAGAALTYLFRTFSDRELQLGTFVRVQHFLGMPFWRLEGVKFRDTGDGHKPSNRQEFAMKKLLLAAAAITVLACPAMADEVGVHVGPVGAGVTVGEGHDHDRDRDRTTVVKEREPRDRTTVIKKEDEDGNRSKTVIHHDND
jgi:hypothetical protein